MGFFRTFSTLALSGVFVLLGGCGWRPWGTAADYLRRGNTFATAGNFADAELQYRKALQKDGGNGEAYLRYGKLLSHKGRWPEAVSVLGKAAQLLPGSDEARRELGRAAASVLLRNPTNAQIYGIAKRLSDELLARNPGSPEGWRIRGYVESVDGHPPQVIDALRRSLAADSSQPDVVALLAETLLLDNQGPEAERLARGAVSRFRGYAPLYDVLYRFYQSAGRAADAESMLRTKISDNPGKTLFVIELADHLWKQHDLPGMDKVLQELISQPRIYPHAYLDAGDFRRRIGELDRAFQLYDLGLGSDPALGREYLRKGAQVRTAQGRLNDAAQLFEILMKRYPDDQDAITSRADLRMATKDPREIARAIGAFEAVLKKNPENNQLRYHLANAYREAGRAADAKAGSARFFAVILIRGMHYAKWPIC